MPLILLILAVFSWLAGDYDAGEDVEEGEGYDREHGW